MSMLNGKSHLRGRARTLGNLVAGLCAVAWGCDEKKTVAPKPMSEPDAEVPRTPEAGVPEFRACPEEPPEVALGFGIGAEVRCSVRLEEYSGRGIVGPRDVRGLITNFVELLDPEFPDCRVAFITEVRSPELPLVEGRALDVQVNVVPDPLFLEPRFMRVSLTDHESRQLVLEHYGFDDRFFTDGTLELPSALPPSQNAGPIRLTLQPSCLMESFNCYESVIAQRLLIGDSKLSVGSRESAILPEQGFAIYTKGMANHLGFVESIECDPVNHRPGIGIGFTLIQIASPDGGVPAPP